MSFVLLLCCCVLLSAGCFGSLEPNRARIPDPDGLLHIYVLPIGQGDTNIIQCPDGSLTVYDFGSSNKNSPGFWGTPQITDFLEGRFADITNVVITHNHFDHYSYLEDVLHSGNDMSGLENVFISCTADAMATTIGDWLEDIDASDKIKTFNEGRACGMNGVDCGFIPLCPANDNGITAKVMSANYGDQCESGNPNIDSVVIKIVYDDVSVLLNGDFEDFTTSAGEEGPQYDMVSYYGDELKVTVYQIAHHGATSQANKAVIRDALHPKAVFSSGNFEYGYGHPRCAIFDAFTDEVPVRTLCKPGDDVDGEFYCGEHIDPSSLISDRVQSSYTCGESSTEYRYSTNNEYAIYTTTPTEDTINLITFSTDGTKWGFINNIQFQAR